MYDIFVNCNWVVTRWQYTFTHKQYIEYKTNNTQNITTEGLSLFTLFLYVLVHLHIIRGREAAII